MTEELLSSFRAVSSPDGPPGSQMLPLAVLGQIWISPEVAQGKISPPSLSFPPPPQLIHQLFPSLILPPVLGQNSR